MDGNSLTVDSQPKSVGVSVGGHLTPTLHSPDEPGKLSQCLKHNVSTIKIIVVIIIIIFWPTSTKLQAEIEHTVISYSA